MEWINALQKAQLLVPWQFLGKPSYIPREGHLPPGHSDDCTLASALLTASHAADLFPPLGACEPGTFEFTTPLPGMFLSLQSLLIGPVLA